MLNPTKPTDMKTEELKPIPEPIGDFIRNNADGDLRGDGVYYYYGDVCNLLNKHKEEVLQAERERIIGAVKEEIKHIEFSSLIFPPCHKHVKDAYKKVISIVENTK